MSYLGEALGADVTALPLARLRRLSRAVLRLAEAPVPEPSWAFPSQAHAASMTLSALGDDLREVGAMRRELYEEFSEDVWTLACAKNPPAVRARAWECVCSLGGSYLYVYPGSTFRASSGSTPFFRTIMPNIARYSSGPIDPMS